MPVRATNKKVVVLDSEQVRIASSPGPLLGHWMGTVAASEAHPAAPGHPTSFPAREGLWLRHLSCDKRKAGPKENAN